MRDWRSGQFDRDRISQLWHPFLPAQASDHLTHVDLAALKAAGKRLILLDVDNTIVRWKGEDFAPEVIAWIEQAKSMGFQACIISNTKRKARLQRLSERLGVETVRGRFKPSRAMFRLALIKFKCKSSEAVMIGDQLMTDILGANRAGIDAIWVRKMEAKEFGPTAINRFFERLLTGPLYRALVLPEGRAPVDPSGETTAERTIVQQIVRFVIVGGTSFVIDTSLTYLLMEVIHVGGQPMGPVFGHWLREHLPVIFSLATSDERAANPIFGGAASFVAMYNSFIFNRLWTFEAKGKDRKSAQVTRFYIVSVIGVLLTTLLYTTFFNLLAASGKRILFSKALAAGIVAIWNFVGQRTFAFRERKR